MKILMVTAGYKPAWIYGGPTYSVSALSEALVKHQTQVTVLTTNANGKKDFDIKNFTTDNVVGVDVMYCRRMTGDPSSVSFAHTRALLKMMSAYDLIHINGWWNWVAMVSLMICKLRKKPHVLSPRGALSEYTFQTNHSKSIKRILHFGFFRHVLKGTFIHATSHEEIEKCKAVIPNARFVSIPNLIELPDRQFNSNEENGIFKIVFLGRIDPVKNIELLIQALNKVSFEYSLSIIGQGEQQYVERIKALVQNNQNIRIQSPVRGEEKFRELANADLLVLLSHSENFGNVVVEALSQGTAVMVSKHVGASDIVSQHGLGWVIEPTLETCIQTLNSIYTDRIQLNKIRAIAPEIIKEEFSASHLVSRYINECYHVITGKEITHIPVHQDV